MTLDEALQASVTSEDDVLVVDGASQTIYVPESQKFFGSENDNKVNRKYFKCPKIVGDNKDLSKMKLFINFQNANGEKDTYFVDDVKVSGDNITFSWLLWRKVILYKGTVNFILCAKGTGETSDDVPEWNTTLAQGEVQEGLEAVEQIQEENEELIVQLLTKVDNALNKLGDGIKTEVDNYMAANPPKVEMDTTLTQSGKAADAKATGDALSRRAIGPGITFSINESGGLTATYDDGN